MCRGLLFFIFTFNFLFSYDYEVSVSKETVKVFNSFDYKIIFKWTSKEDINKVDISIKNDFKNFKIISYKDTLYHQLDDEGQVEYRREKIYKLLPKGNGLFSLPSAIINIYKNNLPENQPKKIPPQIINTDSTSIEVVNALNVEKIIIDVIKYVLVIVLFILIFFLIRFFYKGRKKKQKNIFEYNMMQIYKKNIIDRFNKDKRKKAYSLRDFVIGNSDEAKKKKINIFNKNFWNYFNDSKIEVMGDLDLDNFIKTVEKTIMKVRKE